MNQVDEIAYWFLYGLKLGRISEELLRMKHFGVESAEVVGTTLREFVQNYNDILGQKV